MRKLRTAPMVERIAPPPAGKRIEIFDTIVPALGLRVTDKGGKSFVAAGSAVTASGSGCGLVIRAL